MRPQDVAPTHAAVEMVARPITDNALTMIVSDYIATAGTDVLVQLGCANRQPVERLDRHWIAFPAVEPADAGDRVRARPLNASDRRTGRDDVMLAPAGLDQGVSPVLVRASLHPLIGSTART